MPMSSPFQYPDAAAKLLADMADLNARVAVFDADARVVLRRMAMLELEGASLRAAYTVKSGLAPEIRLVGATRPAASFAERR